MKDTKEIKTPNGHKVVIRSYTTRRDDAAVEALMDDARGEVSPSTNSVSIGLGIQMRMQAKYVELLVKSLDDDDKNLPERLLDLRSEDYNAIDDAVQEITTSDPKETTTRSPKTTAS